MASNLEAIEAMASNLLEMAPSLIAMASKLEAMASKPFSNTQNQMSASL